MSDGEEEELRPPRTPEQWEPLTGEEDRVDKTTGKANSDLEGAVKIRFCKLIARQQVTRWSKSGKSIKEHKNMNTHELCSMILDSTKANFPD